MSKRKETHQLKNKKEKESYNKFIQSGSSLRGTINDSQLENTTSQVLFNKENEDITKTSVRKTPFKYKITDFFLEHLIELIFSGVILGLIAPFLISLNRETGVLSERIDNIKANIAKLENKIIEEDSIKLYVEEKISSNDKSTANSNKISDIQHLQDKNSIIFLNEIDKLETSIDLIEKKVEKIESKLEKD